MKHSLKQYAIAFYEALHEPEVNVSDVASRFVSLLKKDGVLKDTEKILTFFQNYWNTQEQSIDIIATTKHPLSLAQKKEIGSVIVKNFGVKQYTFAERMDPAILGGIVLRAGDTCIDGSTRRQLAMMRARMMDA